MYSVTPLSPAVIRRTVWRTLSGEAGSVRRLVFMTCSFLGEATIRPSFRIRTPEPWPKTFRAAVCELIWSTSRSAPTTPRSFPASSRTATAMVIPRLLVAAMM